MPVGGPVYINKQSIVWLGVAPLGVVYRTGSFCSSYTVPSLLGNKTLQHLTASYSRSDKNYSWNNLFVNDFYNLEYKKIVVANSLIFMQCKHKILFSLEICYYLYNACYHNCVP